MSGSDQSILLGVDGGATKVRVHHVLPPGEGASAHYQLSDARAERTYPSAPGFSPVDVPRQLDEYAAGRIKLSAAEVHRGEAITATIVECIVGAARQLAGSGTAAASRSHESPDGKPTQTSRHGTLRLRIGIGMPGLKTADGRGIVVLNNGPRMPDLADRLEAGLRDAGLEPADSIARIGSDGDYCGLGEQYAVEGAFRDVNHAYYLGGGTGLAEALKLRGRLVTLDEASVWIAKAWQIPSILGPTFEQLASAAGMNQRYRGISRRGHRTVQLDPARVETRGSLGFASASSLDPARNADGDYPERAALRGEPSARQVLEHTARALAELLFERIETIYRGRGELPHRGELYAQLRPEHEYRGLLLERIVLGQQIGRLYARDAYAPFFCAKLDAFLADCIAESGDADLRTRYLAGEALREGLIVPSRLRAASALGAAIDADAANRDASGPASSVSLGFQQAD